MNAASMPFAKAFTIARHMIMGSFGRYAVETAHDHEAGNPQRVTTSAAQPQDQNTPVPSWP